MHETLIDLVIKSGARVLSVVGLAKNTGKTTTLLYLVGHHRVDPEALALTSTGRDGEAIDEITRKEKPRITIHRGTVATTSRRSLGEDDGLSMVRETPFMTATDRIVVVRAARTARVVLEGPATAAEMGMLAADLIEREGARRVIIDGSLDRIAAAAPEISGGVILTAGAVLGPDSETAIKKTRHVLDLFMTAETSVAVPRRPGVSRYYAVSADGKQWETGEGSAITDLFRVMILLAEVRDGRYLFLSGALSDGVLNTLMENGLRPVVIVKDATRLFVSRRALALYRETGGIIEVERRIRLIALTVNPHNPEGVDFDPDRFLKQMRDEIPVVPVFDIVREESGEIETRA